MGAGVTVFVLNAQHPCDPNLKTDVWVQSQVWPLKPKELTKRKGAGRRLNLTCISCEFNTQCYHLRLQMCTAIFYPWCNQQLWAISGCVWAGQPAMCLVSTKAKCEKPQPNTCGTTQWRPWRKGGGLKLHRAKRARCHFWFHSLIGYQREIWTETLTFHFKFPLIFPLESELLFFPLLAVLSNPHLKLFIEVNSKNSLLVFWANKIHVSHLQRKWLDVSSS